MTDYNKNESQKDPKQKNEQQHKPEKQPEDKHKDKDHVQTEPASKAGRGDQRDQQESRRFMSSFS